jgi:hypothetical protein
MAMYEELTQEFTAVQDLPPLVMAVRLVLALACGGLVAGVYLGTQRRDRQSTVILTTTLVLLTVLV